MKGFSRFIHIISNIQLSIKAQFLVILALLYFILYAIISTEKASIYKVFSHTRWVEPRLSLDNNPYSCSPVNNHSFQGHCNSFITTSSRAKYFRSISITESYLNKHQRALLHIARGSTYEGTKSLLESSDQYDRGAAAFWNDLAAYHLMAYENDKNWKSIESALHYTNKSLKVDSYYSRSIFNRALIFEKLNLHDLAISTWNTFLRRTNILDPWRREAYSRLNRLKALQRKTFDYPVISKTTKPEHLLDIATRYPSEIRHALFNNSSLLSFLIKHIKPVEKSGCYDIYSWNNLGVIISRKYGDTLLLETVNWICASKYFNSHAVIGLENLILAIDAYYESETENSLNHSKTAIEKLSLTKSPLLRLAESIHAISLISRSSYSEAEKLLYCNIHENENNNIKNYPFLAAHNCRYLGTISIRKSEYDRAVQYLQKGINILNSKIDPIQEIRLKSLIAETYARAGKPEKAWSYLRQTLSAVHSHNIPKHKLQSDFHSLSLVAQITEAWNLKESLATTSLYYIDNTTDPTIRSTLYRSLADAKSNLSDFAAAEKLINLARTSAKEVQDLLERTKLLRFSDLSDSNRLSRAEPSKSIELLKKSYNYFIESNNIEYQLITGSSLVDLYIRNDYINLAKPILDELNNILSNIQENVGTTISKLEIQYHNRKIFENNLKYELSAYTPSNPRGIQLLNNSNYNLLSLKTLIEMKSSINFTRKEIKEYINKIATANPNEAVLLFAYLDDSFAAWLVYKSANNDNEFSIFSYHKHIPELKSLVEYSSGTHPVSTYGDIISARKVLYKELIKPASEYIKNKKLYFNTLRIIPDGFFFGIPFPGLISDSNEKNFLAHEYALIITPDLSLSKAKHDSIKMNKNSWNIQSATIFANPNADPRRPLQALKEESTMIYESLNKSIDSIIIYDDDSATSNNFVNALSNSHLLHFGGHGEVNLAYPENSRLIFKSVDNKVVDSITVTDLDNLKSQTMPYLIVLAACDTAAYTDRLPHAVALVRPLLDNGTGQIIASLRPIPDKAYLKIMRTFYHELDRTKNPVIALKQAQITLSRDTDPQVSANWPFLQLYQYL